MNEKINELKESVNDILQEIVGNALDFYELIRELQKADLPDTKKIVTLEKAITAIGNAEQEFMTISDLLDEFSDIPKITENGDTKDPFEEDRPDANHRKR